MPIVVEHVKPPCTTVPEIYQDELLHSPPSRNDVTPDVWNSLIAKRAAAHRQCAGCPVMVDCLYRAVVEVDVSGFVACTTEVDRRNIRKQLGIEIQQSSTTPYGAPRVGGGPVSHDSVMTMRQAYPKDTCNQLAERLGCSTSTVKRHLRRAREHVLEPEVPGSSVSVQPTVDEVLDCFDDLASSRVA